MAKIDKVRDEFHGFILMCSLIWPMGWNTLSEGLWKKLPMMDTYYLIFWDVFIEHFDKFPASNGFLDNLIACSPSVLG